MEEGLAASVTNTYGSGVDQSTKHFYAGAMNDKGKSKNKDSKIKGKGNSMACKKKKPGKK